MNPPDAQDLADFMRLEAVDGLCEVCIEAATRYAEARRFRTDPVELWTRPEINLGVLQYGALLYQVRSTPTGLPEYDELQMTYGSSMAGIYRLLGGPDPAVA